MPARFEGLNIPPHFFQHIRNRATVDAYLVSELEVAPTPNPVPIASRQVRNARPHGVRRFDPQLPVETRNFRAGFPEVMSPLRGFRAPILEDATNWFHLLERANHLTPEDRAATQLINHRLAHDGLLSTLAQVLAVLGPAEFATCDASALIHLQALGFPEDLLACFATAPGGEASRASLDVVHFIAEKLVAGFTPETLTPRLAQLRFHVPQIWPHFEVASESGGEELGLLRMQVGGGFFDGIVPGDSIHLIGQLMAGLAQADAVVSVPEELVDPFQVWASQALPLRRAGQLTLISTPAKIEGWAQDNGKAGTVRDPQSRQLVRGALTPRYASRQEGLSYFLPSESFLIDGLTTAGIHAVRFPLLFQGGNLLAVTEPATGRKILLIGEGEIHRNLALGLRPDQIVECFRRGFGVDACVVLPVVSYHLDFDLNVREIGDELVAFVNDPLPAVQLILELGIDTLERHGLLDRTEAAALRYDLKGNGGCLVLETLSQIISKERGPDGRHRSTLAAMFKRTGSDSAAGNLQVFLQALTLLESELTRPTTSGPGSEKHAALRALHAMDDARQAQAAALSNLGWRIVNVPSLPDLYRGINYLNGIHHRSGYVMPVHGGFYAELDAAAESVFRSELGPDATILRIQCAELQRKHGAVHCAAVAYPVVDTSVATAVRGTR